MSISTTPAPSRQAPVAAPARRWLTRLFLVDGTTAESVPFETYDLADQVGRYSLLDVEVRGYLVVRVRGERP